MNKKEKKILVPVTLIHKNDVGLLEEVQFCPICGAEEEYLTGSSQYDNLFKRDRYDYYCNCCYRSFVIFRIKDDDYIKKEE